MAVPVDRNQLWGQSQFQSPTSPLANATLDRFKRKQYGIPADIANRFHSTAASNAYTAGRGVTNQITRGLQQRGLGRSAAFLSAPQAGAQAQTQSLQDMLLPFAIQNAQFGEGQRQFDTGAGLNLLGGMRDYDINLRRLLAAQDLKPKDPNFAINTPFGGISF